VWSQQGYIVVISSTLTSFLKVIKSYGRQVLPVAPETADTQQLTGMFPTGLVKKSCDERSNVNFRQDSR